jgi:hypothetical protein
MDIDLLITHNKRNICRIIFISKGSGAPRSYKIQSLIKNKNTRALSCILIHQGATAVRRFHMLYFTVFSFLITKHIRCELHMNKPQYQWEISTRHKLVMSVAD